MPFLDQRRNRREIVFHKSKDSGMSRHGQPPVNAKEYLPSFVDVQTCYKLYLQEK